MSDLEKLKNLLSSLNLEYEIIKRRISEDNSIFITRGINEECILDLHITSNGEGDHLYYDEVTAFIFKNNGDFIKVITYH